MENMSPPITSPANSQSIGQKNSACAQEFQTALQVSPPGGGHCIEVPGGALVQESHAVTFGASDELRLALQQPDFVSASHIASALNRELGDNVARVVDAGAVSIKVPAQ